MRASTRTSGTSICVVERREAVGLERGAQRLVHVGHRQGFTADQL